MKYLLMAIWLNVCTAASVLKLTRFSATVPLLDLWSKTDPSVAQVTFAEGKEHITMIPPWNNQENTQRPVWDTPWEVTLPFTTPTLHIVLEDIDDVYNDPIATLTFHLNPELRYAEARDGDTTGFLSYTLLVTPPPDPQDRETSQPKTHPPTDSVGEIAAVMGVLLGGLFCAFLIYALHRYRSYHLPHIDEAEVYRPTQEMTLQRSHPTNDWGNQEDDAVGRQKAGGHPTPPTDDDPHAPAIYASPGSTTQ